MNTSEETDSQCGGDARHLSQIRTDPVVVRWLTADSDLGDDVVTIARRRFFDRYCDPVYAFVRGLLREPSATDEVVQKFAVRVLERSFRGYKPEQGRFRDYLKMTLRNMVTDHWRGVQRQRRFAGLDDGDAVAEVPEPAVLDTVLDAEEGELEALLEQTFARLREFKQSARPTFYEVLTYVTRHPDQTSEQAAAALSLEAQLAKPLNAAALRQTLRRAREKFQELLLGELSASGAAGDELIQERLSALGIGEYFKKA